MTTVSLGKPVLEKALPAEGEGQSFYCLQLLSPGPGHSPQQVSKGPAEEYLCSGPGLAPGPRRVSPIVTVMNRNCPQVETSQAEGLDG